MFRLTVVVASIAALAPVFPAFSETAVRKVKYDANPILDEKPVQPPVLPDIARFTAENIARKIPELKPGKVSIVPMMSITYLWKFTTKKLMPVFTRMQGGTPVAIQIQSGVYDMDSLMASVANAKALSSENGEYILKKPLYIDHDAVLVIRGKASKRLVLKMLRDNGAFIVNAGQVFILDSEILAWDFKLNTPAEFIGDKDFRPFYTAWTGSETYFGNSLFRSMGYSDSKAYGVSFSSDVKMAAAYPARKRPTGWVVGCRFEDMYYGFYSYEADDIAVIRNVYAGNVIYGVDPHDRSRRLVIAENEAFGTRKKHGIIVSREVNDSWIFNNKSHDNHGSGLMLDRSSQGNIVANNISVNNGAYGLALFESQKNYIYNNQLTDNRKDGMKIRNSWDIVAVNNTILRNQDAGVIINAMDISDNKTRDFKQDPYTMRASVDLRGGTIGQNAKGDIVFDDIEHLGISDLTLESMSETSVQGNMSLSGRTSILDMIKGKKPFQIVPENRSGQSRR